MPDLSVTVTSTDLRQFYVDLKAARADLMPELRRGMKSAAKPLVDAVKKEASWSSRIPAATSAKVSFSAKSAGVTVKVDSTKAPEARPLDNRGRNGQFRHPVFADAQNLTRRDWAWVNQQAQPFWSTGLAKADADVDKAMLGVLDALAKKAGFK